MPSDIENDKKETMEYDAGCKASLLLVVAQLQFLAVMVHTSSSDHFTPKNPFVATREISLVN